MRSSRAVTVAVVVALAVLVESVLVAVVAGPPASFGWFSYSPLTATSDMTQVFGNAVLLSRVQVAASVVAALALAVTTGLLGYALGRRVRAPRR